MLHDLSTNGIFCATQRHFKLKHTVSNFYMERFLYRLEGYINFVGQVRGKNDAVYLKLKQGYYSYQGNFPIILQTAIG